MHPMLSIFRSSVQVTQFIPTDCPTNFATGERANSVSSTSANGGGGATGGPSNNASVTSGASLASAAGERRLQLQQLATSAIEDFKMSKLERQENSASSRLKLGLSGKLDLKAKNTNPHKRLTGCQINLAKAILHVHHTYI